ncbi:NAD(P)-dependent oxidoreductase [Carboxylicivirga sp. N1Y90]|uniref:NAD(P)-dependent oxidoreductase n=1 Tax=Carboxylicivirga fragile TaxID=3417571 RepID=UPI003D3592EE|nr:hypothetical protein [Marinilabiliaceae bacterium N1Y90]
MLNVYVDKDVKGAELFIQVLASSRLEINAFSCLTEIPHDQVDVAVIWLKVPTCLKAFINLKLLLTSGSGVDHLINSDLLPKLVPIIRLVDKKLRNKVADYVIDAVAEYKSLIKELNTANITVGMMGLGLIGETSSEKLKQQGYNVIGWAKSDTKKRSISDVYTGLTGLHEFAKQSQVVVCQLPLTEDTKHILNNSLFDSMPNEGYVINVGRGGHLNENDLIDSINKGHLKGACLDVFKNKPHPELIVLQNQDRIKLTHHIAGGIFPEEQAKYAIEVIEKFFTKEENIEGEVNFKEKY